MHRGKELRLNKIIKNLEILEIKNYKNYNIKSVTHVSSDVDKGSMFICIVGNNFDGNDYANLAVECGCRCIVSEKSLDIKNATVVVVKNIRKAMSIIAKNFYHKCCDKLKLIGVIGTSGKTTTSMIIAKLLSKNDKKNL